MSAVAVAGADARPGLGRLTGVELRKMVDTRAGLWLQVAVVALTVAAVVVLCLAGDAQDRTLWGVLGVAVQPASVLLPVVGILLVTSEWSQRTALVTFALVPVRSRVLAAKLLASLALGVAAYAVCLVVSVVTVAVAGSGVGQEWSLGAAELVQSFVYVTTGMVTGVAFGAALLASAPAIVAYFALPTAFAALGSVPALTDVVRWLDTSRTLAPMVEQVMSSTQWARAGTALALWMVLPLLIGLVRITRRPVPA